jgi:hypothetical protein
MNVFLREAMERYEYNYFDRRDAVGECLSMIREIIHEPSSPTRSESSAENCDFYAPSSSQQGVVSQERSRETSTDDSDNPHMQSSPARHRHMSQSMLSSGATRLSGSTNAHGNKSSCKIV